MLLSSALPGRIHFFLKLHSGCSHSKEKVGRRTGEEGREGRWHCRRHSGWGPSLRMPCTLLPLLTRSPQQESPQSQSDFTAQEKEVSPWKRQENGRSLFFSELNKKAGYGSTLPGFPGKKLLPVAEAPENYKRKSTGSHVPRDEPSSSFCFIFVALLVATTNCHKLSGLKQHKGGQCCGTMG